MAIRPSFRIANVMGEYIKVTEAVKGRYSEVYEINFSVKVPVDTNTSLPLSSRQYSQLEIVKSIDESSPRIFQYLIEGTKIPKAILTFYSFDTARGGEKELYELKFEGVTFTGQSEMIGNAYKEAGQECPPVEKVCLVAEKVTKTYIEGHIQHADAYKEKAMGLVSAA